LSQDAVLLRAGARGSEAIDQDRKLTARSVARRFDVSVRTIDRWLVNSHMAFPMPAMTTKDTIGRVANRYWRLSDLVAWERRQAEPKITSK
jgi:predicted DNA-binding transcriptional regulator YafY